MSDRIKSLELCDTGSVLTIPTLQTRKQTHREVQSLPKATQMVRGEARVKSPMWWILEPMPFIALWPGWFKDCPTVTQELSQLDVEGSFQTCRAGAPGPRCALVLAVW